MDIRTTRQVLSMIHSARPIVRSVANIVFCCFVLLGETSGDERTYVRTSCAKTIIPTGRDFGLAEWINICKSNDHLFGLVLWVKNEDVVI